MTLPMQRIQLQRQAKDYPSLLTPEALAFLAALHEEFNYRRLSLLHQRELQQQRFDAGAFPQFLTETAALRNSDWKAGSIPTDLQDRRVEITGPVDRKMIINALNSGANVFMADFEDSCSPTWSNIMEGQRNLQDAVDRTISLEQNGKTYKLNAQTAVLIVRPRGLHLEEKHLQLHVENLSASLVDFGLFFFHNAKKLLAQGSGPYFYLPKLEHYHEAKWWNDVFEFAQNYLQIPVGTIKATVLIETITASFQLDEIIYSLKPHIVGLNCGRWDYIFSYIKKLKNHIGFVVPDRDQVTMQSSFMQAYSQLVVQRSHKRGILAIGGMAAQIPVKNDDKANQAAFEKVQQDKLREVKNGHDGTWVAHPGLVAVAKAVFDTHMPHPNQMNVLRDDLQITEADLLENPSGTITEAGVRKNIHIALLYIESWLMGTGAAALYNLMEDAATAEISRMQLWQWLQAKAVLEDGRAFTRELYQQWLGEEILKVEAHVGEKRFEKGQFTRAIQLLDDLVLSEHPDDFLTLKAYAYL